MDEPTQPQAHRQKYWNELDDAEKIERMHGIVKSLINQVRALQSDMQMMDKHQHGFNGELLTSISHNGYQGGHYMLMGTDELPLPKKEGEYF